METQQQGSLLEFEKDIRQMEDRIEYLRQQSGSADAGSTKDLLKEISSLEKLLHKKLTDTYSSLDSWQTCLVARHPGRPRASDYLASVFTGFQELHGDRMYGDDKALIGGLARFDGQPVVVLGQEKGATTEERIKRNWGMPHPEGYRKALRLYKLAAKFGLPVISLVDTPGAYCGIGAEERGMSQAIGTNLVELATLPARLVSVVIGEGGSGGALAISISDSLLMFEHSVYSVISPEGCSSILWKNGESNQQLAANAMKMRASELQGMGLVDQIISEPVGGAHRDPAAAGENLAAELRKVLGRLRQRSIDDCVALRAKRLRSYGVYTERRS